MFSSMIKVVWSALNIHVCSRRKKPKFSMQKKCWQDIKGLHTKDVFISDWEISSVTFIINPLPTSVVC